VDKLAKIYNNRSDWTGDLFQQEIQRQLGITYSRGHAYALLKAIQKALEVSDSAKKSLNKFFELSLELSKVIEACDRRDKLLSLYQELKAAGASKDYVKTFSVMSQMRALMEVYEKEGDKELKSKFHEFYKKYDEITKSAPYIWIMNERNMTKKKSLSPRLFEHDVEKRAAKKKR